MVVRTQKTGVEVTGLRVGAANVRRYFPRCRNVVRLHLGDLEIECRLNPDFWRGKPEIQDPRLCKWLEFRTFHDRTDRKPAALTMEQAGTDSYRLQAIAPRW